MSEHIHSIINIHASIINIHV